MEEAVMVMLNRKSFPGDKRHAGARGADRNPCSPRVIEAASTRNRRSFKTNPIVPSLPNGAARCAFGSSGAQRQRDPKSGQSSFF
jgi:hypothetical protein